jgi:hypothetical protein
MKIGRFELPRLRAAQAQPPASAPKELGATGTLNLSGLLVPSEYNDNLRGLAGLAVFDQMMRSDGSVQEAIEHILAPIKNANWDIAPAGDDPDELEQAAFVRCAYFSHLNRPWIESLDEQLDYLIYGHAVFETVYQIVEETLYYDDPTTKDQVELPPRQFVSLQAFEPRLQQTLYKWMMESGELKSVVQRVWVDARRGYQEIEIPAEQLLVLVNKLRGNEWTGRSILRSAYKHWFAKDLIEKQEIVALERWGVQIPVGYPPDDKDEAAINRVEQILVDLRGGENSYIASPGPKQTGSQPGYVWELMATSGTFPDFSSAIERHRSEIKAAVLARFSELGHQRTGARATGDTQSIVWFAAIHAVAKYICESHNIIIQRLVDANYSGVTQYPTLEATDIEIRNLAEYGQAISQLLASGAITNDRSTEAAIRKAVDLPDQDELTEPDPSEPMDQTEPEQTPLDQQQQNGKPPEAVTPPKSPAY